MLHVRHDDFGHDEAQALAQAAKALTGATSAGALADLLGKPERGASSTVQNWLDGRASPRFEPTMRLLRLVGALNEERWAEVVSGGLAGQAATVGLAGLSAPGVLHEAPLDEVAELLREVRLLLPELRAFVESRRAAAESHRPETAAN